MGVLLSHVSGVYGRPVPAASVSQGASTVNVEGEGLLEDDNYNSETDVCLSHSCVTAVRGRKGEDIHGARSQRCLPL